MNLFRREKPDIIPHPVALADEAIAAVGEHDAKRAESIARLEELESRLDANIRREMGVLASVRTELTRERAAATGMAFAAVEEQIDAAIEEIELDLSDDEPSLRDQIADEIERDIKARRDGTERRPKRTRPILAAAE